MSEEEYRRNPTTVWNSIMGDESENSKIEKERYLCLSTVFQLFCVDLHKLNTKPLHSFPEDSKIPSVPFNTKINLINQGLPFGARSVESRIPPFSNINRKLLLGGDVEPRSYLYRRLNYTDPLPDYYVVRPEFEFNSNNNEVCSISLLKVPSYVNELPRMCTGKSCPFMADIGGKLYVLHTDYLWRPTDQAHPPTTAFEVFDPDFGVWKTLPNPLFYPTIEEYLASPHLFLSYKIQGAAVVGHRIFVTSLAAGFAYFDTKLGCWFKVTGSNCRHTLWLNFCTTFVRSMPYFFDHRDDHIHLLIQIDVEPTAYLVNSDGVVFSQEKLYSKILQNVCPSPDITVGFHCFSTALIPLESIRKHSHKMCAVVYVFDYVHEQLLLSVSIFSLSKRAAAEPCVMDFYNRHEQSRDDPEGFSEIMEDIDFLDIHVESEYVAALDGFEKDPFARLQGPAFFL